MTRQNVREAYLGAQLLWGLASQPPILGMTLRHCEGAGHQRLAVLPW